MSNLSPSRFFSLPPVSSSVLKNGLKVYVVQRRELPLAESGMARMAALACA